MRFLVRFWGIGGTCLLLIDALWRLMPFVIEIFRHPLTPFQWLLMGIWVSVMAYAEGYRGFQLRFSPRVVARSSWLSETDYTGLKLLAPLVAMGMITATRRRLVASWLLVTGIVILVLLIRQLEQPWRGVVDAGVVVGLGWGLLATIRCAFLDWKGRPIEIELDLPDRYAQPQMKQERV